MSQYYFVEALHFAGMSDSNLENLKKVFEYNPTWVNEFNKNDINPVLVAIEAGNVKMVEHILKTYQISDSIYKKMINSASLIEDLSNQHKILKLLLNNKKVDKNSNIKGGKKLINILLAGSVKNIDLAIKHNLSFKEIDADGNPVLLYFIDNFNKNKKLGISKILKNYTLDEILSIQIKSQDMADYIGNLKSLNNENKDILLSEIDTVVKYLALKDEASSSNSLNLNSRDKTSFRS